MEVPETRHLPDKPPTSAEDAEILAEIARGNLRRFDVLVDRYKVRLMSYIGHRVPDRHHAEDLAQESFLRLFRAARNGGYSGRASVSTWLFTIADNCTTDHLRASCRRPLTLETDTAGGNTDASGNVLDCRPSAVLGPAEAAARRESQRRTETLLGCLPDEQRRVVALKVLGGLTLAEVAAVVGCPLGTAKSRLLYGLRKIEASLSRLGRTELTSLPAGMTGLTPEMQKELMHTTAEVMQLDAARIREESILPGRSGKTVLIWDGVQGKTVYLYPSEKRATVINQADMADDETSSDGLVGYAGMFRSALFDARDTPDVQRESLGEKEIDGRRVVGFRIDKRETVFRVWGDPKTGLPVLIEATSALMPEMKITMSDFVFNVDMDESLFNVEPPAGYEVKEQQASTPDDSPAEEKDLIEMFRYHSEFDGGRFPALLDMLCLVQTVHMQLWLADSLEQDSTTQHQEKEGTIAQAKIARGLRFVTLLPKEADSHYAGRGISLGTADTPVFWYRPRDAKKYRVIYADLLVGEAETPPNVPQSQPVPAPSSPNK